MKDKPVSHKNSNTFRFQTFAERISSITIDVIHDYRKISSTPDEADTFFKEAFEKWIDLNFTLDYENLRKDIGVEIQTLSQIVFRKDEIIEILLKHLSKTESLALDAILELVVALARDLQHDFYPYFPKFFSSITFHLTTNDTDLLEKLFTALAYLFKFLWKYMIKDIENVYRLFSTLLSDTNKEHIRIFAVESFAFLIRKVQNKEKLFLFIFSELEKSPEKHLGVGQLFFEVVKGVKQQFHSCAEIVLKLLFGLLGNENCSAHLIQQSLEHMFSAMCKHTVKTHCVIIQDIFCDFINELIAKLDTQESSVANHLDRILKLFLIWIEFKKGSLITSNDLFVEVLISLCHVKSLPEYCMKSVVDIMSAVMISSCVELPVNQTKSAISKIYSHSTEIVFYFTRCMYKYGMFEKDLLPVLLSECLSLLEKPDTNIKVLEILSETIATLKPVTLNFEDIESFTKLYFYSSLSKKGNNSMEFASLEKYLLQTLSFSSVTKESLSEAWSALICLPHLRLVDQTKATSVINEFMINIKKQLLDNEATHSFDVEECSFVLLNAYYSLLLINKDEENNSPPTCFFTDLLRKYPLNLPILHLVDLYFSSCLKNIEIDSVEEVMMILLPNLSSPYHKIRQSTLRLLCSITSSNLQHKAILDILNICYEAEKVPLDVQNYREKLKWLRKLEYSFIEKDVPVDLENICLKVPVYYLLGMLYVNFKLLWDPTILLLESFAHGKTKLFWDVFFPHLDNITNLCEQYTSDLSFTDISLDMDSSTFCHHFTSFCKPKEKPDLLNHRMLLWKAMEHFPNVVEAKNKIIVPFLFQFIMKEVHKIETSMASTENINRNQAALDVSSTFELESEDEDTNQSGKRKRRCTREKVKKNKKLKKDSESEKSSELAEGFDTKSNSETQSAELILEDMEVEEEIESKKEEDSEEEESESEEEEEEEERHVTVAPKKANYAKRKYHVSKTLAAYLSVFAKFKNPKGGYKAEELETLYKELLCYYDPVIQKLAFDCILTFNHKFLHPYKDNFYRILENKTFKTEVVLFSLDSQNEIIQNEHRMNVLAILMRVLYGKMLYKTGNNTVGKAQANTRRSLVLRFLAGCKADELKMFFDLVFLPFKEQLNDDTLTAVKKIRESINLGTVVPIRRQHSALNTLGLILQHLGNLIPELLPWLLKVLLIITATSTTLLEKRDEVLPQCVNILKTVRTLAVMKLMQFFHTFKDYEYSCEEIDAIFESIVWSMLPRLEFESVNQPSPLLRFMATWSENQRYFPLFAKHHDTAKSLTPLPHIMSLYSSNRVKSRVVGVISKIVLQLLTLEDDEPEEEDKQLPPLKVNFCVGLTSDLSTDVNFGIQLLLPYIDKILTRFEITACALAKKRIKKSLSTRDLNILLKISCFVDDSKLCFKLIQLLTPFLLKPKLEGDNEVLILNNISNLIKKSENPDYFIKLFAPLFGKLTHQGSRIALVNVFTTLAEVKPEMQLVADTVSMLNALDSSLVEEPDYQQRLDGHKKALEAIKQMDETTFNENFIRIIIFNSSFTIRKCDDIALRNSATYLMQEIIKSLSLFINSLPEVARMLLFDTLLLEVQKGLKSPSESVRHEFILILSTVVRTFKDLPNFKDLALLCDEDREVDFWENIRHLQVHRRARALLRFANILKDSNSQEENNSVHYIVAYMFPIVQSFLFDTAYKKHVHVIDAAIETLGQVAMVLPWHHYEPLLKQYLILLSKDAEHHKTIVKIIVSLLNAFHFDLSKPNTATLEERTAPCDESKIIADNKSSEGNVLTETKNESQLVAANNINKIHSTIKKNILPHLHRSLMQKNKREDEHKLAGAPYYPENDEILRVPIALAMVKLLQKLPTGLLERNLPGLFLKMCGLLKSRTESIRETTRETLIKMMQSLGPQHFRCLLSEIKGVMTKGYQVHVMTFTINAVLTNIADQMKPSDLDSCVKDLTEICMNELFTDMAEEKEVSKITGKLKEARSFKSYSIFQILSKYISENILLELIVPLKEILSKKVSHKIMRKVSECLRHIALGLSENGSLTSKGQLLFIHAIINESIPGLNKKKKIPVTNPLKYERPDIYLVPKEPGRSGPPAKVNERTTSHVLVEFGLQLFQFCLKKDRIEKDQKEILQMLDPFVSILTDCLESKHIKIITTALRCLNPLFKYTLPSFTTCSKKIVASLFILVNKYAAVGMGQGENFEMIVMCFKLFTALVRDSNFQLSEEQLQSLLSYIEQDIYDYTRQATAFSLLKAILSKRLAAPGLKGIMSKIAEMAITAEQDHIRVQCRQACMQYMLDYPLGKQLQKPMSFFIGQLEYHLEPGRVSALEIVNSMVNNFPEEVLKMHSALFLIPLAVRLVNDESPSCRKMAAQCIKKLLTKVQHDGRLSLFSITFTWLQAKKVSHKRLGAQLCGMFAEVEGEQFENHLHQILPVLVDLIITYNNEEAKSPADERSTDHFLFHILNALAKMLTFCPIIKKEEFSDDLNIMWDTVKELILYPHMWVRLAASQLFGLLLSVYSVDEVQAAICNQNGESFIYLNNRQKLRDLSADFCTQLQSPYLNEKLSEQVIRNLVYLAKVISILPETTNEEEDGDCVQVTLGWMIRKLCREVKKEVAEQPSTSQRRKCVFLFLGAVVHELGKEKIIPLLNNILLPLCREIADSSKQADEELKKNAQEVINIIQRVVGIDDFTSAYADVQTFLLKKKAKRKQDKAKEAITDPEKFAQRKMKKQKSKKESKKRKIMKIKGKRKAKKPKLADLVIAS
ncbi:small subunit processome component 20 homolog [Parasteatoda tepidariorum]|uniref:small subunit processome component 20 homolog n=1 Tax=Parasteatoda tepidariorum TaxID=114398 RepID=UPI00077F8DB8|nr:small subunit processome component 20 homolog [Parasteatoda tepidariorum]